ncbi:MAG: hypothetical protein U9Q15_00615 [Patescibacteria group bacterium]|nr:hypothetical protein [Patescibacteria group bacterium]
MDIEQNPDSYTTEEIRAVSIKAMKLYNADNQFFLSHVVHNDTLGFVTNHTEELIKEYDCTTASEKILAQSIAGAY